MKISIGFSGPAGFGVNTAGILVGNLMSEFGFFVYGDKEYQSIIKGGNNTFILHISDKQLEISKTIDYFIGMDKYAFEFNQKVYDLKNSIEIFDPKIKNKNIFSVGIAMFLLCGNSKKMHEVLEKKFGDKEKYDEIVESFEAGLKYAEENLKQGGDNFCEIKAGKPKKFTFGNNLIAKGACDAGLEYYSFYPMTPSTSISDELYNLKDSKDNKHDLTIFQGENEISVSMSVLGASFGGKRAMCATSGGGFALMVESISFAYIAEIASVFVLCQRDGPSTGTPTFHSQGDLGFALNPTFGDIEPIVVYPSDYEDAYNLIGKTLNRSQQYQTPIIFLSDKQMSECYYSVDMDNLKTVEIQKGKLENNPDENFARYKLTNDGVSPYTIPGTKNGEYICTSYEHGEFGESSEDLEIKKQMMDKRAKKIVETFRKNEFTKEFKGYEIINPDAKKLFVSVGMNSVVLKQFIGKNNDWGIILIKVLKPLNLDLKDFFEKNIDNIEILKFVEHNHGGHLEKHIKTECELFGKKWDSKIQNLRNYQLYPFFIEDIK